MLLSLSACIRLLLADNLVVLLAERLTTGRIGQQGDAVECQNRHHKAFQRNSSRVIEALLENGANLEARSNSGQTPLLLLVINTLAWRHLCC
jgi:hypothetical protein